MNMTRAAMRRLTLALGESYQERFGARIKGAVLVVEVQGNGTCQSALYGRPFRVDEFLKGEFDVAIAGKIRELQDTIDNTPGDHLPALTVLHLEDGRISLGGFVLAD